MVWCAFSFDYKLTLEAWLVRFRWLGFLLLFHVITDRSLWLSFPLLGSAEFDFQVALFGDRPNTRSRGRRPFWHTHGRSRTCYRFERLYPGL